MSKQQHFPETSGKACFEISQNKSIPDLPSTHESLHTKRFRTSPSTHEFNSKLSPDFPFNTRV
ncbi:hypothetical protein P7K49_040470 [Saguinus oedipus]|uniref:Uncharacterized protein n=1 Tax=Saguinus oedipus TaxID=9490 RepID=A0ABQ9TA39_SAGOE|nr:hypothetical protein P7K49_040459 [Saguinus oedipus]KAK2081612.1 hypothetical protein P7K49_040462 [Saguinus oedipus]KAK2081613.1 hypothetical protein P7K49_040463 [Saguinus oedipus]KAK2081614.1 hypothetical protein P7K49_040464 [Saguinus oedipus]KAK2081615.1 hypothetical protein P7K49_040465 [Saguinus oedipus]